MKCEHWEPYPKESLVCIKYMGALGFPPEHKGWRCRAHNAITWTLCNVKVGTGKNNTHALKYKGLKKEIHSTNNVGYDF